MFISNALFGTEALVFPWNEKTFWGTDSPIAWKSAGYKICYPIKVVLIGPFNDAFHDDPPPPLVALVFALYWSVLAVVLHFFITKKTATNK
jgi:biotin transporter BioY